jgi:hypothetical protein
MSSGKMTGEEETKSKHEEFQGEAESVEGVQEVQEEEEQDEDEEDSDDDDDEGDAIATATSRDFR